MGQGTWIAIWTLGMAAFGLIIAFRRKKKKSQRDLMSSQSHLSCVVHAIGRRNYNGHVALHSTIQLANAKKKGNAIHGGCSRIT
ncbi:putative high choriolytic enzyme 1-like [Sesbania bispinosa]|nr:putative high choriolytic enzyme 1-like [Sesbania bispinosa]